MCQVIWSPLQVLPRLQPQRKVRKLMCSSRKYPYPPSTQGTFILDPHPLKISVIFHLGWGPPGKTISAKKLLHYTTMRNVIVAEIR